MNVAPRNDVAHDANTDNGLVIHWSQQRVNPTHGKDLHPEIDALRGHQGHRPGIGTKRFRQRLVGRNCGRHLAAVRDVRDGIWAHWKMDWRSDFGPVTNIST